MDDAKFSKFKEQILKIDSLKNMDRWGVEYQLWLNKTEKLVDEIFGQEKLKLFQLQCTTTTSYIDDNFNAQQYLKELDNRKKVLEELFAEIKEYNNKIGLENQNFEINIIKEIWRKEQAMKENLLLTQEVQPIQKFLLAHLEKILSKNSIPGLRFRKLCAEKRFQTWWTDNNGYPADNAWTKIEPFLEILQQYEAEKTIKHRLETEGFFVESRSQGEDQHLLIGMKDGSGEKSHIIIDGKTGEIRVEDNQKEPAEMAKIVTILTMSNGKKIRTTREAIEEIT